MIIQKYSWAQFFSVPDASDLFPLAGPLEVQRRLETVLSVRLLAALMAERPLLMKVKHTFPWDSRGRTDE